jgi:hypothetical protein
VAFGHRAHTSKIVIISLSRKEIPLVQVPKKSLKKKLNVVGIAIWCPPIYYHLALKPLLQHHFQPPTPPKANFKKKHGNIKRQMLHALLLLLLSFCLLILHYPQALKPFYNLIYSLQIVHLFLVTCFQPHNKNVYPNATHF